MAPRGTPKNNQLQRPISSAKPSPAKSTTMSVKKTSETLCLKDNTLKTTKGTATTTVKARPTETRLRTRTEPPKAVTPNAKENKPVATGSVTKSGKKAAWRRRPKPAHSGVPVPEKMRKLLEKYLQEDEAM